MRNFDLGTKPTTPLEAMPESTLEVVRYNLATLQSDIYRQELLVASFKGSETVDGKRYVVSAANGHANKKAGHILSFGHDQFVDPEIVGNPDNEMINLVSGLHMPNGISGPAERQILHVRTREEHEFTADAVNALLGAVMLYNQAEVQQ